MDGVGLVTADASMAGAVGYDIHVRQRGAESVASMLKRGDPDDGAEAINCICTGGGNDGSNDDTGVVGNASSVGLTSRAAVGAIGGAPPRVVVEDTEMLTNTTNAVKTVPNTDHTLRDGTTVCAWRETAHEIGIGGRASSSLGSSVVAAGAVVASITVSLVVIATLPLSSSSKSASKHTAGDDSMSKLSLKWRVESLESMVLAVCSNVETVADTGFLPSTTVVDVSKRFAMRRFDSSDDEEHSGVAMEPEVSDGGTGVVSTTRDGLIAWSRPSKDCVRRARTSANDRRPVESDASLRRETLLVAAG